MPAARHRDGDIGPVTGATITDVQIISVVDECGYPPGASAVTCPTCTRGPGWQCRNSRGMPRAPHADRKRAAKVAYEKYAARCAAAYNARAKEGR
jgi:hypothetical protein